MMPLIQHLSASRLHLGRNFDIGNQGNARWMVITNFSEQFAEQPFVICEM